jgi:2-C-methyl-D-erythritol 4-phosphate cytidylyltransferase
VAAISAVLKPKTIHEAPAENLKVTTPLDLRVAEVLLTPKVRIDSEGETG